MRPLQWYEQTQVQHLKLSVQIAGKHEFVKMSFECTSCRQRQCQGHEDFIRLGAWPATPHGTRFETIIDRRTFRDYMRLKFHSPQSSMQGFLRMLEDASHDFGYQVVAYAKFVCVLSALA